MITSIGVIMHLRTRTYHICPFRQAGFAEWLWQQRDCI